MYIPSVFATKAAILVLFSRIFAVHHHVARAMHVLIALLFLTLLPIECMKIAVCRPVSVYWELSTTPDVLAKLCVDQATLFKADITVAIITDFMILIIPMPLVFSLSFTLWKKIRILLSLATGSGAVGVALYKGIAVFNPSPEHDPTKNYASLAVLTCVYLPAFCLVENDPPDDFRIRYLEMNIGLMCACFPTFSLFCETLRTKASQRYKNSSNWHRRRNGPGGNPFQQGSGDPQADSTGASWTLTTLNTQEVAVLAAQPGEECMAVKGPGVGVKDDQGRCVRIDSTQDRSEGWLTEPAQAAQV